MKYIYTLIVSTFILSATAQDFNLYQLRTMPQNLQVNPGFMPTSNYHIAGGVLPIPLLPAINLDFANSFALKDVLHGTDTGATIDMSSFIESMPKQGQLRFNLQVDIINFGFKIKDKHYFHMIYQERTQVLGLYSKELLNFIWKGNGHDDFLGKTTRIAGFGADVMQYGVLKLGYTQQYDEKLSFGVTPTFYFGHAYISSKNSYLEVYTSDKLDEISITPSIEMNTGGVGPMIVAAMAPEDTTNGAESSFDPTEYISDMVMPGFGVGIDFGANYKLNDQIEVNASVIDLGFIGWGKGSTINNDAKTITFNGVDPADLIGGQIEGDTSSGSPFIDSLMSDVKDNLTLTETTGKFNSGIATKVFLGGTYKIDEKFSAGILLRNYFINKQYKAGVSINGNVAINNWLSSSITYSIYNNSYTNVGLGTAVNMGPIQFYVMMDNVVGLMMVDYTKNFNMRFGFNIRPTHNRKLKTGNTPSKTKTPKPKVGKKQKIELKEDKVKVDKPKKTKVIDENK